MDYNGTSLRRLVFLSSKHIVQTEAQLVRGMVAVTIYVRVLESSVQFQRPNSLYQNLTLLFTDSSKGKGSKKKTKLVVNTNHLTIGYYSYMVAGLAFLENFHNKIGKL